MDISVYNNSWIVPAKCGSRYLDIVFSINGQVNDNNLTPLIPIEILSDKKISITESNLYRYVDYKSITHIVLRDPESYLHAALHTDLWGYLPYVIKENGLNRKNIKLMNILHDYCDFGTHHWSPFLYESIYWFLQFRPDVKIILLSELTEFVKSQTGKSAPHTPNEWNFSELKYTRNEIVDWIKTECPDIWKAIQYRVKLNNQWWEIINNKIESSLPFIKDVNFHWKENPLRFVKDVNFYWKEITDLPKILKIKKRLI